MPKEYKITCDSCGRDLTYTGNAVDYRLALKSENIANYSDSYAVTAMISPPIEQDAYFCSMHCLTKWVIGTYPDTVRQIVQKLSAADG